MDEPADRESLRVWLRVSDAYPELYDDLRVLASRRRCQRLLTLATIGLAALRGGLASHSPPPGASGHASDQAPGDDLDRLVADNALGDQAALSLASQLGT